MYAKLLDQINRLKQASSTHPQQKKRIPVWADLQSMLLSSAPADGLPEKDVGVWPLSTERRMWFCEEALPCCDLPRAARSPTLRHRKATEVEVVRRCCRCRRTTPLPSASCRFSPYIRRLAVPFPEGSSL
jgi:hypothetical protein